MAAVASPVQKNTPRHADGSAKALTAGSLPPAQCNKLSSSSAEKKSEHITRIKHSAILPMLTTVYMQAVFLSSFR